MNSGKTDLGPLSGVRILDLSRWIAGPFATMLMADAGADVIKVEGLQGEDARHSVPTLYGTSAYVHHYNRNKRGLAVDFRCAEGRAILKKLATEWADVVVENFRPGILEAMGLGYEDLSKVNPGLVMVSISGFGRTGPESTRPSFNTIAEAFAGAMSLTGDIQAPPTMSGFFAADHATGLYAAFGTMLALTERAKTGRGQFVELSLANSMLSILGFTLTARLNDLPIPPRTGNRDNATAPADLFWTRDQQPVYIDAGTDRLFETLCGVMQDSTLASDPKFATNKGRLDHWKQLYDRINVWTMQTSWEQLRTHLTAAKIPFSAINTIDQAINEPQFADQKMFAEVMTADGSKIRVPGMALKMSCSPGTIRMAAPFIGQHSVEVLNEQLGMTQEEINALIASGAIGVGTNGNE